MPLHWQTEQSADRFCKGLLSGIPNALANGVSPHRRPPRLDPVTKKGLSNSFERPFVFIHSID
jgi:hypothetical protein